LAYSPWTSAGLHPGESRGPDGVVQSRVDPGFRRGTAMCWKGMITGQVQEATQARAPIACRAQRKRAPRCRSALFSNQDPGRETDLLDAVAFHPLALHLAGAADGGCAFARALLAGLFV